jgi:hypothetical protein
VAGAAVAFGVVTLVTWNGPVLTVAEPVYVALFVVVGAPGLLLSTGLTTCLQDFAPAGSRGRVLSAAGAVSAAGQAVGMVAAGVLADRVGLVAVLDAQAVLYLLAGLVAWWWLARPMSSGPGAGHTVRQTTEPFPGGSDAEDHPVPVDGHAG